MTDKEVPDFCIFQNSRTHQSAIWTKQKGWHKCEENEYFAVAVVADLLRNSPNLKETIMQISKAFTILPEDES